MRRTPYRSSAAVIAVIAVSSAGGAAEGGSGARERPAGYGW
jgi:hypothetical protein